MSGSSQDRRPGYNYGFRFKRGGYWVTRSPRWPWVVAALAGAVILAVWKLK